MNRYTYNGELLELTDIAEDGLVTLMCLHEVFIGYKEELEKLLEMQEEGIILLMLIFEMKHQDQLGHSAYPTILHPLIDNLINEMFSIVDLCSGENARETLEYEELTNKLSIAFDTTEKYKVQINKL